MVVQMMAVGEETGALDEMLDKIADFYDQEVEATVEALTSLIEPLLIVVMGVCVGGMVISLYLPMFNIIKLIKSRHRRARTTASGAPWCAVCCAYETSGTPGTRRDIRGASQ